MPYKDELDLLLGLPKATNNEAETASALKVENMALKDEVARLTALLLQASNSTPAITVGPDAG
jgi:hypothetical protein